ncbi:ArnT family glycosyltransferase [Acidobacteriota bacterium]
MTYDERHHYDYGERIINGNSERSKQTDDSKMPLSALNALPKMWLNWFGPNIKSDPHKIPLGEMKSGRYITILFSLLLAFFVYTWSSDLYGWPAGIFSLLLYVFSPNILAHSRLITTDLYGTTFCFISTYFFWRFIKHGRLRNCLFSALTLGIAQLAKYTAIYLVPIYLCILAIKILPEISQCVKRKNYQALRNYLFSSAKAIPLYVIIVLLLINAGFLFRKTLAPLSEYEFKSTLFQGIQQRMSSLDPLPVAVPKPYIDGLDWVKFNEQTGASFGHVYMFEELRFLRNGDQAFQGYYIVAFLYKTPIAVIIIALLSIGVYLRKKGQFKFHENEVFLIVPIIFFALYFNFMFKAQIGIRYLLVVYPFIHVFCGLLFREFEKISQKFRIVLFSLLAYLIISVLSYFPHYLSYFNELVGDRKMAYKILADSNIDWGQNEWYLKKYRKNNPDVILRPNGPTWGKLVVGVNELVGILLEDKYAWLRENFEPVDHIAYSYLIFDISEDDLERAKLY